MWLNRSLDLAILRKVRALVCPYYNRHYDCMDLCFNSGLFRRDWHGN